jgi:prophage regulatory protein
MSLAYKILSPHELKTLKGIRFSRQHLHRLIKNGRFPKPIKLGPATNGWLESEIDAWIALRASERDAGAE